MTEGDQRRRRSRWTTWALVALAAVLLAGLMGMMLLAGVLVRRHREMRQEEERRAEAIENLKRITGAAVEYQAPNGDFFPAAWDGLETQTHMDDPTAKAHTASQSGDKAAAE